jgi:hypothetical protein
MVVPAPLPVKEERVAVQPLSLVQESMTLTLADLLMLNLISGNMTHFKNSR